jgi:AmmeMemoRadiSam system protein A
MLLDKKQSEYLLKLARDAIVLHLEQKTYLKVEKPEPWLTEKCATFVTLTIRKQLRGCIGHLHAMQPLHKDVIDNAVAAAFFDPRFEELTKSELEHIHIEISILTPPVKLEYKGPEELLKKIDKYTGVIISDGISNATFLPQVWEEIPKKEDFFSELCAKAGLPPDAWKGKLEVHTYKVKRIRNTST